MWSVGEAYEACVGRWSRLVAAAFLAGLGVPAARRWLDVGCGTGALTAAEMAHADRAGGRSLGRLADDADPAASVTVLPLTWTVARPDAARCGYRID